MKFKLTLDAKPSNHTIAYGDKLLLIGSCFTENIEKQITKREKKNAQSKIYWAKHSKEINERRKERMICSCGLEICKRQVQFYQHFIQVV
jgi:hypothetical protein